MANVYGIDLGMTYSVIATLDDNGMPEVIDNYADGGHLLASAVYFPNGGDPVVGEAAKNWAELEPDRVVQFIKREIGKSYAQIREFDGVKYDPISISALILKRMKEYAEELGHEVNDVVITCPAYFGNEERAATKQAGIIAGFNVLNIVNEPMAAALNYCCRENKENRNIMVYDLGGGTFDITLLDFSVDENGKALIDVLETGGSDRLGGIDWDARLYDYICELYTDENGVDRDEMEAELRQKIRSRVEDVKKSISKMPSKSFAINYGGSTRLEVTREKFEELTKDLVEWTMDFVRQILKAAKRSADDVDVVLLVGGSTLMPMVKAAVEGLFPGKVRVEQPDLAVAKGAALAAAMWWGDRIPKDHDENKSASRTDAATTKPIASYSHKKEEALTLDYDLFDLTGLPFDPPEKAAKKVSAAIDKAKKELGVNLGIATRQLERDEINRKLTFLKATSSSIFGNDGKLTPAYDGLAKAKTKQEIDKLAAAVSVLKKSGSSTITNGAIRIYRRKTKLSKENVEDVFRGAGFTITEIDPLKALPKFPTNTDRIHADLEALRKSKDPNPNGADPTLATDLYAFAAYLAGEPENAAKYRGKPTTELKSLLDGFAKKLSNRNDDLGKRCASLAMAGKIYVFDSEDHRQAYEAYLKYKMPALRTLFDTIKLVPTGLLYDSKFAEVCIKEIMDIFGDYEVSLAIYNKEAGLKDDPYIPAKKE